LPFAAFWFPSGAAIELTHNPLIENDSQHQRLPFLPGMGLAGMGLGFFMGAP
jgi:hypothetical protein